MKDKVKILTILLAALLAASLLVTACTNPTNGEPGAPGAPGAPGTPGEKGDQGDQGADGGEGTNGSPGQGVPGPRIETVTTAVLSPSLLASYFDTGVETVYLSDVNVGSSTLPAGLYTVPKDKTLVISGNVPAGTNSVIINAVDGTLDLSTGDITGSSVIPLMNARDIAAAAAGGKLAGITIPTYLTAIPAAGTISGDVVLSSLTLGTGGITPSALATYANSSGSTVYVAGDLVVNGSEIDIPSGVSQIVVYGDIRAEGNISLTDRTGLTLASGKSLKAAANITVTGLDILTPIPLDTNGYQVVAGNNSGGTALTAVTLAGGLNGAGVLELPGAVTSVAITAGDGNVRLTNAAGVTSSTALNFGNTGATTITGPVSLGHNLTVAGSATLGGTLTNTAAATAMFNGPTTITGAVTTGTGGLTIDGTGAVTLSAAPTLTTGLTVDNTAGVTIPSVTLPAGQAINATGKVIFGTAANSAAIEGGTLTSAAGGLVTVAADGVISLPFNTTAASLVLDAGGRIAIVGTGKVVIGTTAELKGAGSTWDAGTDDVTFEPTGLAGASIEGGTNATLTPSGANAELYLLAASAAQTLTFSGTTSFTLDLSGVGKITFDSTTAGSLINLAANTNGIKLTSVLAIVGSNTAATAITAGDFVDGGGAYNATTCNVSLIDGVIKHNTINAAAPIAIDKTTVAVDLASNDT